MSGAARGARTPWSPEPAVQLAALRIVVCAFILLVPELREGVRVASLDPSLRVAPEGLGWFVRHVPIDPTLALVVEAVAVFAALAAIAGVRARLALAVLTVSAGYLFALADLNGWVWHDLHLLWLAALLAASPCDRALAFDRVRGPRESVAYTAPLLASRLLLAAVYFFPGVQKLATSGIAWALSDNLANQLRWKWIEYGEVPALRLDQLPHLLQAGGLLVLAFEIVAPVLFVVPRARPYAAVAGLAFHLATRLLMRIDFSSLWACYVVLVDPTPLVDRAERAIARVRRAPVEAAEAGPGRASIVASALVGGALLTGVCVQGVRGQMQSFPFACYPTFAWRAPDTIGDLRVEVVRADGTTVDVPHGRDANGRRSQRQWATIWSVSGQGGVASGEDSRVARLVAYYREAVAAEPAMSVARGAVRVRFYAVRRSVVPEERDAAPVASRLLADVPLEPRRAP